MATQNLLVIACLLSISSMASAGSKHYYRKHPPHILYVMIDDLGWSDVGFHGGNLPSPNIDDLARDGIRLERHYTQPVCSPTRSAMMTGLYPFHTGFQHVGAINPGAAAALPLENDTIAEVLLREGYSTHMIGKWHLGYASWKNTPLGRGFQSFRGILQQEAGYYNHSIPSNWTFSFSGGIPSSNSGRDLWDNDAPDFASNGTYVNDIYMAEARRVIDEVNSSSTPSFVYFAMQNVHTPLELPPTNHTACAGVTPAQRYIYCQMLAELDVSIGKLVDMYKEANLWDNTLMIVTSDNGGIVNAFNGGWPGSVGSNWPLRAGKATLFEGGIRAIGFVQGGDKVIPYWCRGAVRDNFMHAVDWLPTILEAAGLEASIPRGIDGVSQWEAILGKSEGPRTELPVNIVNGGLAYSAMIVGEWKLIVGSAGWYDGYWAPCPYEKYVAPCAGSGDMLFNIIDDPTERRNVASEHPDIVADLKSRIAFYVSSTQYREPQDGTFQPASDQSLHNGTWAPWLDTPDVLN